MLVILAILIVGTGGTLLFAVTAALSLIGMFELYRVVQIEKKAPGFAGYAAGIFYYILLWFHKEEYIVLMAIMALMILWLSMWLHFPTIRPSRYSGVFRHFLSGCDAVLFISGPRNADGRYLVWLIVLSSWGCDTFAYCAGMLFGKHKLTPVLSPKKTVEGAVGAFWARLCWA